MIPALLTVILLTTILRLLLGYLFFGFHSGDDVEILSAAFRTAFHLNYSPWEIRNLFQSTFFIAPWIGMAHWFGVQETQTLLWFSTFPFVCLASLNIFLLYSLAERLLENRMAAGLAAFLYAFHWLPLGYGATVYPRIASTTCILAATLLAGNAREKHWRIVLSGILIGAASAFRYSEVIFALPLAVFAMVQNIYSIRPFKSLLFFASGVLAGIGLFVGLVDFLTWGKPFASLIAFAKFTLIEKQSSSAVKEQPLYWYLTSTPKWLPLTLIPILLAGAKQAKNRCTWLFIILPLLMLSMIHHKEMRYLQGIIPFFYIVTAAGAVVFWRSKWRMVAAVLLFISFLWGFTGLRFHLRKSMAAVVAAQELRRDASIDALALSQSWAYGQRLYFGNRVEITELPVPPSTVDIQQIPDRVDAVGIYQQQIEQTPDIDRALQVKGFTSKQIFTWGKSKSVVVYRKTIVNREM